MAKRTNQKKDHSGKYYLYKDSLVELLPTFVYEISISKYWHNGYCYLGSKFYKANRVLHTKCNYITKKYKDHLIEQKLELVGVPKEFIEEMQLKIYKNE